MNSTVEPCRGQKINFEAGVCLNVVIWNLFVIWCLAFVISDLSRIGNIIEIADSPIGTFFFNDTLFFRHTIQIGHH